MPSSSGVPSAGSPPRFMTFSFSSMKWKQFPSVLRAERGVSGGAARRGTFARVRPIGFDWDDEKAESNVAKHGVTFEEAMAVFDDDHAAIRDDPDHSIGEHREIIVGQSDTGRINARTATPHERKLYEEKLNKEV